MKNTSLVSKIFLLITLTAGLTYAGEPQWISDSKGCKVANVFPQEDESINWTGACEQGLATGEGKLTWLINGIVTDTYEGQLVKGWAEGEGKLTRKDGVYTGEWKNSLQKTSVRHLPARRRGAHDTVRTCRTPLAAGCAGAAQHR